MNSNAFQSEEGGEGLAAAASSRGRQRMGNLTDMSIMYSNPIVKETG